MNGRFWIALTSVVLGSASARANDDTLSWLLTKAATAPSTRPAITGSQAASPLTKPASDDAAAGTVTLSTGENIAGRISTTPGKPLRIWVEEQHEYVDVAIGDVAEIRASVLWEREEPEWHFIASGSDVKEYTGKTYPARETAYTFKLRDGREISGSVVAPLYVRSDGEERMVVLHKRDKGQVGLTLRDLMYVRQVTLSGQSNP